MRKHIPFNSLSCNPTDHESADGDSALLLNLISEDGALRPVGIHQQTIGTMPDNCRLRGVHQVGSHRHLIIEQASQDASHTYLWTDPQPPLTLHRLYESDEQVNAFAAMGDTLCLVTADSIVYALWDDDGGDYCVLGRDDLLYDITVTQDQQQRRPVSLPISSSLAGWLDTPTTVLGNRQTMVERMFPGFYDRADAYATGATMIAATMAAAADHEVALQGQGTHRGVRFGIAALRLADGSHTLYSNVFALFPASLPTEITADRDTGTLHATAHLHRHTISVAMRHPAVASRVVSAVDIFLTREVTMLDMRQAATIVTDMEGRTTALAFGHLDRQAVADAFDHLEFYKAMTIGREEWGVPLMVPAGTSGEAADLSDLRRWQAGGMVACAHDGRLSIGAVAHTLFSPLEIGLTYRYHTLDAATRLALDDTERETAVADELTAGSRADIADNPLGQLCDIVVSARTTSPTLREVCWAGRVQYPIAGMMMVPSRDIEEITYHVRLDTPDGMRYYTTTQRVDPLRHKGFGLSVYTATRQAHHVQRAALHSLLLQQAHVLAYDPDSGLFRPSFALWDSSTAEAWQTQAAKARSAWTMPRQPSLVITSPRDNPFVFPLVSATQVGDGEVTQLVSNTRRTADGLFGDGQYYAFTTRGIWVLRLAGERWKAQQTVTRDSIGTGSGVAATDDAVAYTTSRGLMMVKGSVSTCLSDDLRGAPFTVALLPHYADIVATEPALAACDGCLPDLTRQFIAQAQVRYDGVNHRLWLTHPQYPSLALIYSLRSKGWGTAVMDAYSTISDGDGAWLLRTVDGQPTLVRADYAADVHERCAVLSCSRPLSLGLRHVPKTAVRVMVRGLFDHRGTHGSHVGMALYGSDDLTRWHLIGSSANQYMRFRSGRPYKWFRVLTIGRLLPGESIEGVSIEMVKRRDNKLR